MLLGSKHGRPLLWTGWLLFGLTLPDLSKVWLVLSSLRPYLGHISGYSRSDTVLRPTIFFLEYLPFQVLLRLFYLRRHLEGDVLTSCGCIMTSEGGILIFEMTS